MKISSVNHCIGNPPSASSRAADLYPENGVGSAIRRLFRKIDRILTAISYAEVGNFDAVKEILDQDKADIQRRAARRSAVPAPSAYDISPSEAVSNLS